MAKITMLDKSGYVLTTGKALLVFDYYKDPEKALEKLMKNHPHLPVIFFVSNYGDNLSGSEKKKLEHHHGHHHDLPRYEKEELDPNYKAPKHEGGHDRGEETHFNHDIFNLAQDRQRMYVLSDDIAAKAIRTDVPVAWIHAGDTLDQLPGGIVVKAYGTNEKGVSFLVTLPCGSQVFYAGDFSSWQTEEDIKVVQELFNKFVKVLHRMEEDVKSLKILFFPVDPRIGDSCYQEARLVMQNIKVDFFVPMQFGGDYKQACDFDQYITDNTKGLCLHSPSQTVELNGDCGCQGSCQTKQVPD